jgi:hypothetical protein
LAAFPINAPNLELLSGRGHVDLQFNQTEVEVKCNILEDRQPATSVQWFVISTTIILDTSEDSNETQWVVACEVIFGLPGYFWTFSDFYIF